MSIIIGSDLSISRGGRTDIVTAFYEVVLRRIPYWPGLRDKRIVACSKSSMLLLSRTFAIVDVRV
jgi:hypothetical protein